MANASADVKGKDESKDGVSIDDVLEHNSQLSEQVQRLVAQVEDLTRAAGIAAGIDVMAQTIHREKERKLVQFRCHYARTAVESKIQKGENLIEQYSAKEGEIVLMDTTEIDRLRDAEAIRHIPAANGKTKTESVPIIETEKSKFVPITRTKYVADYDERGRMIRKKEIDQISVRDLIKRAKPVG